jgi:hypothetical protein
VRTRGWTLQQVASAVKRSIAYVSKRVRLFEDPLLRAAVAARGLPVSTAEELLTAAPEQRAVLIERAIAERWDLTRAGEALTLEAAAAAAGIPAGTALGSADSPRVRERQGSGRSVHRSAVGRPPGFTRLVRDFHRAMNAVRAEDLSPADRSALRSLFRDLVLLARTPTTPRPRVIPPLPTTPPSRRRAAPAKNGSKRIEMRASARRS